MGWDWRVFSQGLSSMTSFILGTSVVLCESWMKLPKAGDIQMIFWWFGLLWWQVGNGAVQSAGRMDRYAQSLDEEGKGMERHLRCPQIWLELQGGHLQKWGTEKEKCVEWEVPSKHHTYQIGVVILSGMHRRGLNRIDLRVSNRMKPWGMSEVAHGGGVCREWCMGTELGKLLDPLKSSQSCLCLGLLRRASVCAESADSLSWALSCTSYAQSLTSSAMERVPSTFASLVLVSTRTLYQGWRDDGCHSISYAYLSFLFSLSFLRTKNFLLL